MASGRPNMRYGLATALKLYWQYQLGYMHQIKRTNEERKLSGYGFEKRWEKVNMIKIPCMKFLKN